MYDLAKRGSKGRKQLRVRMPQTVRLDGQPTFNADKFGVFQRNGETVNEKPLYVKVDDSTVAIWWANPDRLYPTGMWLVGRYDKKGQDSAYHIAWCCAARFSGAREDGNLGNILGNE